MAILSKSCNIFAMTYFTVEVELDHGRVIPKDADKLPATGHALLTILQPDMRASQNKRPMGLAKGKLSVPVDFNAPLPEDVLREFEAQ
jgi:hypothetical protein